MTLLLAILALLTLVAALNWILIPRPPRASSPPRFTVLIPARNEEANLRELLPALSGVERVWVYDDDSEDGTAEVARSFGARVVRSRGPLPEGWTGKNHACHQLGLVALEDSPDDFWVFLDADTRPTPDFAERLQAWLYRLPPRVAAASGFLRTWPGRGLEPLAMAWVWWILLATNPFGLVARTGKGHNGFTNGQFVAWRAGVYAELMPHKQVSDQVLEDVAIGRLLARERRAVVIGDMSSILGVRMYATTREALDGMAKNTYEITGSTFGTWLLALTFVGVAVRSVFEGWLAYGLLVISFFFAGRVVRSPLWIPPLAPLALGFGAIAAVRSILWRRAGRVRWKGRTYGGETPPEDLPVGEPERDA